MKSHCPAHNGVWFDESRHIGRLQKSHLEAFEAGLVDRVAGRSCAQHDVHYVPCRPISRLIFTDLITDHTKLAPFSSPTK